VKETIYLVVGKQPTRIIKAWEVENFMLIKDTIRVYTFNTKEEKEAFLKGFDEAIGYNEYEILNDLQINFIMKYSNND
jgi:hypothetical protein